MKILLRKIGRKPVVFALVTIALVFVVSSIETAVTGRNAPPRRMLVECPAADASEFAVKLGDLRSDVPLHNILDGLLDLLALQAPDLGCVLDRHDGTLDAVVGDAEFFELAAVHQSFPMVLIGSCLRRLFHDANLHDFPTIAAAPADR